MEASRTLHILDPRPGAQGAAARCSSGRSMKQDSGLEMRLFGDRFSRSCRLGIRAPCPVDLPDAAACRAQKRGANIRHESTPRP
jgi:hypothetical protein